MRRVPLVLAAILLLSGCSPAVSQDAPEGLSLSVYQNRVDVEARKLEVSFLNETGSALTVTRLELRAGQFGSAAIWPKESTVIPDGVTISLPVSLPEPACDATPTDPVVEFDYALADGRAGTAVVTPVDTLERLPGIREDDCLAHSVAAIAAMRLDAAPRLTTVEGRPVIELDLALVPTGAAGSMHLGGAGSTTLFVPVGPDGSNAPEFVIDLTVAGTDPPSTATLRYSPNRCDAHAIAEDKRGTIIPVAVSTSDGFDGRLYISSPDGVRDALYDLVRTACGLPTG